MDSREKIRINALMDLKDDGSETYVLTSYESLLKDIDTLGLKQDDIVYIYYSHNEYKDIANWYYSIERLPVKFANKLVVSTIGDLLAELKRED